MMQTTPDFGMLKKIAAQMRRDDIRILGKAGSGHPGGSLSIIEVLSVLYFGKVLRYDPKDPQWADRDRVVLSKGHTCPALYIALAYAGFFPKEELDTLRQFESRLQGHTDLNLYTPGVETSGGPLGQGLSVGVGMAIASKMDKRDNVVYTIIGDGESAKGGISEAAKCAGAMKLNNMITFLDYNKVDQDGRVGDVQPCQFVQEWQGYGWATIQVPGDDVAKIHFAISEAHRIRKEQHVPVLIILDTIKGAGISFMAAASRDGNSAWHGVTPKGDDLTLALAECDKQIGALHAAVPGDVDAYIASVQLQAAEKAALSTNVTVENIVAPAIVPFTEPKATRDGFGAYITTLGQTDPHIVTVTAGVAGSVRLNGFAKEFGTFGPNNWQGRFVQVGIAEANMAGVAAGLALAGKKPWMATFDIFVKEALGVIRNSICYNNVDVKIVGTHAGLGVEYDGGSHQSTIVPAIMNDLFRMQCFEPADANETQQLMKLTYESKKPAYFRLTRQKLPLLETHAFAQEEGARIVLGCDNPQVQLVASGCMVSYALTAAKQLQEQGVATRVVNVFSLSYLDSDAFRSLLANVPIVTIHDAHYKILAREVAFSLAHVGRGVKIKALGMQEFGETGTAAELYAKHKMDVASIVATAKKVVE